MSMKYAQVVLNSFLQKIHSGSSANLRQITVHDLVGLLNDESGLQQEFQRRVHYYEELAQDPTYQRLIEQMHSILEAAHKVIDPKKLPQGIADIFHGPRLKRTPNGNVIQHHRTTYRKLHYHFSHKRPWYRIGDRPSRDGYPLPADSIMHPWRLVVKQYQEALALFRLAKESGAYRRKSDSLIKKFDNHLAELIALLEVPWERDKIGSFEFIQEYIWLAFPPTEKQDEYELRASFMDAIHKRMPMAAEQDRETLSRSLIDVCDVLLWYAAKNEGSSVFSNKQMVVVNGVELYIDTQRVSFMKHSELYRVGKLPWLILRLCAEIGEDGDRGRVEKATLHKNEDAVSSEISRINRKWKNKVNYSLLYEKNGYIYLDPRPVGQK